MCKKSKTKQCETTTRLDKKKRCQTNIFISKMNCKHFINPRDIFYLLPIDLSDLLHERVCQVFWWLLFSFCSSQSQYKTTTPRNYEPKRYILLPIIIYYGSMGRSAVTCLRCSLSMNCLAFLLPFYFAIIVCVILLLLLRFCPREHSFSYCYYFSYFFLSFKCLCSIAVSIYDRLLFS